MVPGVGLVSSSEDILNCLVQLALTGAAVRLLLLLLLLELKQQPPVLLWLQ